MYSDASILELVDLIGFGEPSPSLKVAIPAGLKVGSSGQTFPFFHKLCTLENIYDTTEEIDMLATAFTAQLIQMKVDAVKSVLISILDKNKLYLDEVDYSDTILLKKQLFIDAIGYTVAKTVIEQMISSKRMNIAERSANMSYSTLKLEIEGAKNENGYSIAPGITGKLSQAIKIASKLIFPEPIIVQSGKSW